MIVERRNFVNEVVLLFGGEVYRNCRFICCLIVTPAGYINAEGWDGIEIDTCRVITHDRYLSGDDKIPAHKTGVYIRHY